MNTEKIVEALLYILPAILVAGVTYSLIKTFLENEEKKRFFENTTI